MARTRRVSRRPRGSSRPKYTMATFSNVVRLPQGNPNSVSWNFFVVTPSSTAIGMRKAKNFNIEFASSTDFPVGWALCYMPQGASPSAFLPSISLVTYDDYDTRGFVEMFANSQWVIATGTIISGSINRFRTRLARNLNNGDLIIMFLFQTNAEAPITEVYVSGNYALKYN